MADQLVKVASRQGFDLATDGPITLYTPGVSEIVKLLFLKIHALQETSSTFFQILAGSNLLWQGRNDNTNPALPNQTSAAATGGYVFDSSKGYNPDKMGEIKIPVLGDVINADPLIIEQSSTSPDFVTLTVTLLTDI